MNATSATQYLVDQAMEEKVARGIRSPPELLAQIAAMDPAAGGVIAREVAALAPRLIVNQVQQEEDLELGKRMALAYRNYFGAQADFLGAIRSDDRVRHAVRMKRPVLEAFPQSVFAQAIGEIAEYRLSAGEVGNAG